MCCRLCPSTSASNVNYAAKRYVGVLDAAAEKKSSDEDLSFVCFVPAL